MRLSSARHTLFIAIALLASVALAACGRPTPMRGDQVRINWASESPVNQAGTSLKMIPASGRWLVNLNFRRPDGSERQALAWINLGLAAPVLSERLYAELGLAQGRDLIFETGPLSIAVNGHAVTNGAGQLDGQDLFTLLFAPRVVEAVLPAGVLQYFQVTVDPRAATLTLASRNQKPPPGLAVPFRTNPDTGIAVITAAVGEDQVPLALDVGASYTWLRGSTVMRWLQRHPDWYCTTGAIGQSNLAMADLDLEEKGQLINVPEITVGALSLQHVGALGTGSLGGEFGKAFLGEIFWDTWQNATGQPVSGWIGNNVLSNFRITFDYAAGISYWQRQSLSDQLAIDSIGITLIRRGARYEVGAIASRRGFPLVSGVTVGDHILEIDKQAADGLSPDAILAKLKGTPGETHMLVLDRGGSRVSVLVNVPTF